MFERENYKRIADVIKEGNNNKVDEAMGIAVGAHLKYGFCLDFFFRYQ